MPQTLRLQFPGHNALKLDARLEMPDGIPLMFATFSHCFTCTKDTLAAFRISKALAAKGIATLRFDFAGLGGSEGDFAKTGFSTNMQDLFAAVDYLSQHHEAPKLLIGHSLGGTTALACAPGLDTVKMVATIAAPSQPRHVLHHFGKALAALEAGQEAEITVAGQRYRISPQFVSDLKQHDMQSVLAELEQSVLVFNVVGDTVVDEQNALDIQQWCREHSIIIDLPNTDHTISDKQTAKLIAGRIREFIDLHHLGNHNPP